MLPYRDKLTNTPIYPTIPQGMIPATEADIWLPGGQPRMVKVLVQSYHTGLYHAYTVVNHRADNELIQFLKDGKVFIKQP